MYYVRRTGRLLVEMGERGGGGPSQIATGGPGIAGPSLQMARLFFLPLSYAAAAPLVGLCV